ncbi:hypothetical protein [Methylobacterium dankookense]|uniref:hypothetical protein n=1 Tax=Methylobacterium dankookense TaxID=560405 RepID=UPI0011A79E7B|nr:hypothetical protein [Methylobacterium dankookense]
MTPALASEMLADRLNGIEAALVQARLGQPSAVQALRDHLLDILTLVERDPGLDAAADDLHRAALAIAETGQADSGTRARHERLLGDARGRLLQRLEAAGFELVHSSEPKR